ALCLLALPAAIAGQERAALKDALALEEAIEEAIKFAEPSVACIEVSRTEDPSKRSLDRADAVPESYGSGVELDDKGSILTNYHVVKDSKYIYVRLPGRKGSYADIRAADPRSDLAVLLLRTPDINPYKAMAL